jgi:hypothetical protein
MAVASDVVNRAANAQTVERVTGNLQNTQVTVNVTRGTIQAEAPAEFWRERMTKFINKAFEEGYRNAKSDVAAPHITPKNSWP